MLSISLKEILNRQCFIQHRIDNHGTHYSIIPINPYLCLLESYSHHLEEDENEFGLNVYDEDKEFLIKEIIYERRRAIKEEKIHLDDLFELEEQLGINSRIFWKNPHEALAGLKKDLVRAAFLH